MFTFRNLLPFEVDVFVVRGNRDVLVTKLAGKETIGKVADVNGGRLGRGDMIQCMMTYRGKKNLYMYKLGSAIPLSSRSTGVYIGGCVYDSVRSTFTNLHSPISSIQFINEFPFEISVWMHSNRVARLPGWDGRANPTAIFNNGWEGLDIGDELTITGGWDKEVELYTLVLSSSEISRVICGATSVVEHEFRY